MIAGALLTEWLIMLLRRRSTRAARTDNSHYPGMKAHAQHLYDEEYQK